MLICIVNELKETFTIDDIHRIGGDEFVVLCTNMDQNLIYTKMQGLELRLKERNYNISAGYSFGKIGQRIDEVLLDAETKMYQDIDRLMDMPGLDADIDAGVWQAGFRAEYRVETSLLDIVPYAGVRYMSLCSRDYDASSSGMVLRFTEFVPSKPQIGLTEGTKIVRFTARLSLNLLAIFEAADFINSLGAARLSLRHCAGGVHPALGTSSI